MSSILIIRDHVPLFVTFGSCFTDADMTEVETTPPLLLATPPCVKLIGVINHLTLTFTARLRLYNETKRGTESTLITAKKSSYPPHNDPHFLYYT